MLDTRPAMFDERRHTEPQVIIDLLLAQTTRQAVAIGDLTEEKSTSTLAEKVDALAAELAETQKRLLQEQVLF